MQQSPTSQHIMEWARSVASPTEVTLYFRYIPSDYTKADFQELIAAAGYDGEYDYFYLPRCFHTKMCKGYAFLNVSTEEAARGLTRALEGTPMGHGCLLSVSRSATQGLAENMAKWASTHSCRVRDPEVLPSVRPGRGAPGGHAVAQPLGLPTIEPRPRPPQPSERAAAAAAPPGAWPGEERIGSARRTGVGPPVQAPRWPSDPEAELDLDPARHACQAAAARRSRQPPPWDSDALVESCWQQQMSSSTDGDEISWHSGFDPSSSGSDRLGHAGPIAAGGTIATAPPAFDLAGAVVVQRFSL